MQLGSVWRGLIADRDCSFRGGNLLWPHVRLRRVQSPACISSPSAAGSTVLVGRQRFMKRCDQGAETVHARHHRQWYRIAQLVGALLRRKLRRRAFITNLLCQPGEHITTKPVGWLCVHRHFPSLKPSLFTTALSLHFGAVKRCLPTSTVEPAADGLLMQVLRGLHHAQAHVWPQKVPSTVPTFSLFQRPSPTARPPARTPSWKDKPQPLWAIVRLRPPSRAWAP